jgi:hypothetical protein
MRTPRDENSTLWRVKGLRALGFGVRAISRKLSLPLGTTWRLVKAADEGLVERSRHRKNALERWVLAHPEVPLPATTKGISSLTGIPSGTVSACLRVRKVKFKAWTEWVGDPRGKDLTLTTDTGIRVSLKGALDYAWVYDAPRNLATLEVRTPMGERPLRIPILDRFAFGRALKGAPTSGTRPR